MTKNFNVIVGYENNHNVYRILASERIAKIRGNDIIATCNSLDDAEWLCGVLEIYYLLTNKLASSLSAAFNDIAKS